MKKLLLLLLCVPLIGFGQQTWEKIFSYNEEDYGNSVQQTTDGGYIITGFTRSLPLFQADLFLLKTDVNGDSLWTKMYGTSSTGSYGNSIQITNDGGYIIIGAESAPSSGLYLMKTDSQGDSLWTKKFGGTGASYGLSGHQTTDGGYIIVGGKYISGNSDVYLIKTDGNGDSLWTQTFGGIDDDEGYSVHQTTDGGYVITGRTYSFGNGDCDVYLIKTDSNGDSLWTKTFGGTSWDNGRSVQQTTDGGYIITGTIHVNGNDDVYLIKTDVNGDSLWTHNLGTSNFNDVGNSVQQTTDGGYIITGGISGYLCLIKTDSNGDSLWTQTFGGLDYAYALGKSVQQTTDGGYIISGETMNMNSSNMDVYLIKTDGNGNITSEFTIPITSNRELEKVVDILGRDINPEKNKPFIEIYNDGTVEKKIIIE